MCQGRPTLQNLERILSDFDIFKMEKYDNDTFIMVCCKRDEVSELNMNTYGVYRAIMAIFSDLWVLSIM